MKYGLAEKLPAALVGTVESISLYAEGLGVQDLKYGTTGADPEARFFDISYIFGGEKFYLGPVAMRKQLEDLELPAVPLLYQGPFSLEALEEATNGKETLTGEGIHVREGTVVSPIEPRRDDLLGRVILKSVSESYLLRKGDATEYE